ncbi:MAG: zinc-finger domain-containing protein [Phyllobacteriaceae bacterium]|nr:zinc-finger domain-containing protein [Phyllobacteriaceae bacterium]
MAGHGVPHFHNDGGLKRSSSAPRSSCASGPSAFRSPHVFLDMGAENEKVCPYCSTRYIFDSALGAQESRPSGCVYHAKAA